MFGFRFGAAVGLLLALSLACGAELPKPGALPSIIAPGPAPTATALPTVSRTIPVAEAPPEPTATKPGRESNGEPAGPVFSLTVTETPLDIPKYDRSDWRHWTDEDKDCQDARQEALVAESEQPVAFESEKECRVESGRWTDPYTGTVVTDPGDLDVDHVVPLGNAHRSGGWQWDRERKRAYANDLAYSGHLVATTARANRAKGSDGPEEWRPSDEGYWCVYATDWASIKSRWDLWVTAEELAALREVLDTCAEPVGLDVTHRDGTPGPVGSAGGDLPTATPAPESPRYDPAGPDRDCGDFDTWDEAQAFFIAAGGPDNDPHRLDQGGDGVPCESLPGAP
jgi:hypothetical protein